jgi:hypothetical protein
VGDVFEGEGRCRESYELELEFRVFYFLFPVSVLVSGVYTVARSGVCTVPARLSVSC